MLAVAAAAWVVIVIGGLGTSNHHQHHVVGEIPHRADTDVSLDIEWMTSWCVMTVAMMWPLVAPIADAAARRARPAWRPAAGAAYLTMFTLGWLVWGVGARLVVGIVGDVAATWWAVAWLVVAIAATRSLRRARELRRCQRLGHVALEGARAIVTSGKAGTRSMRSCAVLCGPAMTAMAGPHPRFVIVATSAAVWWEQWHPMRWRDPVPPTILAVAAVLTATTVAVAA